MNSELQKTIEQLPEQLQEEVLRVAKALLEGKKKTKENPKPLFGSAKGKYCLSADFDEPLDDFKEYM